MPNLLDPNVCIPLGAVILLIIGAIVRLSPQGKKQHELDKQRALARDKELDKIYGRRDGL
jgi:hypothetical protein